MPTPRGTKSKVTLESVATWGGRRGRAGRPQLEENRAIALTVHRLIGWGFSKRQVLGPVVRAVRTVFPERDVEPAAIEQIWKRERRRAKERALARVSDEAPNDEPLFGWARYWPRAMLAKVGAPDRRTLSSVDDRRLSRPAHQPGMTVEKMATVLLRRGGDPPPIVERVWSPVERKYFEVEIGWHLMPEETGGQKYKG